MTTSSSKTSPYQRGLKEGYRSGLEEKIAADLEAKGIPFEYEKLKIKYVKPAKESTYTPDFRLPNGIIVETKGRFVTADRLKHLEIQKQYPELDIRFVFSNSQQKISKTSKTTYAAWCEKHGYLYADKAIPDAWLAEVKKEAPEANEVGT